MTLEDIIDIIKLYKLNYFDFFLVLLQYSTQSVVKMNYFGLILLIFVNCINCDIGNIL